MKRDVFYSTVWWVKLEPICPLQLTSILHPNPLLIQLPSQPASQPLTSSPHLSTYLLHPLPTNPVSSFHMQPSTHPKNPILPYLSPRASYRGKSILDPHQPYNNIKTTTTTTTSPLHCYCFASIYLIGMNGTRKAKAVYSSIEFLYCLVLCCVL